LLVAALLRCFERTLNSASPDKFRMPMGDESMIAHGVFDSEALRLMQAILDQAWADLPPERRTAETRERIAKAVVSLATHWERDPAQPAAVSPAERARILLGVE
jgi:hypothetical protein